MSSHIKKIISRLEQKNLDGLIVSYPHNISYLVEFSSRDAYFLISKKENFYFTDSRYTEQVRPRLKEKAALKKINGSVFKQIADTCLNLKLKKVAFEERHLPYAEYKKIKDFLKKKTRLIPTHSLVEDLRETKEEQELEKMRRAIKITIEALKFSRTILRAGKREIEIVAELERFIRYQGARSTAFGIIVASGPNSSFPHHISGDRKTRRGEPVLIDIGVDYLGYKSDLTRVFFLDKIKILAQNIYNIVCQAQKKAIENIRPGIKISKIDKAARQFISQKGFGEYFCHNLGHGVGLEVHEEPHISGKERDILSRGMVFTVEPAIYLPREFGIRIEDMVLVTRDGCEVLSGTLDK
jgi:Xaa-Pro aminopeptidase